MLAFTSLTASLVSGWRVRIVLVGEYNHSSQSESCWASTQLNMCPNIKIDVSVDATEIFAKAFFTEICKGALSYSS